MVVSHKAKDEAASSALTDPGETHTIEYFTGTSVVKIKKF